MSLLTPLFRHENGATWPTWTQHTLPPFFLFFFSSLFDITARPRDVSAPPDATSPWPPSILRQGFHPVLFSVAYINRIAWDCVLHESFFDFPIVFFFFFFLSRKCQLRLHPLPFVGHPTGRFFCFSNRVGPPPWAKGVSFFPRFFFFPFSVPTSFFSSRMDAICGVATTPGVGFLHIHFLASRFRPFLRPWCPFGLLPLVPLSGFPALFSCFSLRPPFFFKRVTSFYWYCCPPLSSFGYVSTNPPHPRSQRYPLPQWFLNSGFAPPRSGIILFSVCRTHFFLVRFFALRLFCRGLCYPPSPSPPLLVFEEFFFSWS